MGSLRSALEEFASDDLVARSDADLAGDLQELERGSRAIEVERARRLAEVERRGVHRRDGSVSVTEWLARLVAIPSVLAARQVRLARTLPAMPGTSAALAGGDIPVAAAELLAGAYESDPEAFARCEPTLVQAARTLSLRDLRRVVEHARALLDADAGEKAARRRFERRALHASPTLDGMVRVDGDLDPETGQVVLTALRSVLDAEARGSANQDPRTPAQRRADALGEICRRHLDSPDRPAVAGERPHVTLVTDAETLRGGAGRRCELDDTGRIAPDAARRLACDASIARVILGPRSEPIDLGRKTAVVSPAIRRALVVRDGGCRFPGCDRPQAWCDAHHVLHWADGGETSLSNLVLLCRRHHRAVHDGLVVVRIDDGVVRIDRSAGTPFDPRGP